MNVYFIDSESLNAEHFSIFVDILKIGEIYSLSPSSVKANLLIDSCGLDSILNVARNISYKYAVYRFLDKIKQSVFHYEDCVDTFVVDTFINSKYNNPIWNIHNCEEKNVLVLDSERKNYFNINDFPNYALNILRKYGKDDRYRQRICFYRFDEFLRKNGNVFLNRRWCNAVSTDKKTGRRYDAVLAYMHHKFKELSAEIKGGMTSMQFFLSKEKCEDYDKMIEAEEERRQEEYENMRAQEWEEDFRREMESEMNSMLEQGGDWMLD